MAHTPESAAASVATIRSHRDEAGRSARRFEVTVGGECASDDHVRAWTKAGVDRLIVSPWQRSAEVLDAMADFATRFIDRGTESGR
jgi:hypothetical protein